MVSVYADLNCPFCFLLNEWLYEKGLMDQVDWIGVEHEPDLNDEKALTEAYQDEYLSELTCAKNRADGVVLGTPNFRPSSHVSLSTLIYIKENHSEFFGQSKLLLYRALWIDGQDISKLDIVSHILKPILDISDINFTPYKLKLTEQTQAWRELQYDRIPMALSSSGAKYLGLGNKDSLSSFINSGLFDLEDESVCLSKESVFRSGESQVQKFPLMREMLELTVDPIFLLDSNGKVKLCNKAACVLVGKNYAELIGVLLDDIFPGVSVSEIMRLVKMNYRFANQMWELVSNRYEESSLVLTLRDITVQEQQAQELRRNNFDLEKALQAKQDFLAVVSHEMRTPLNGVIGLTEISQGESDLEQLHSNLQKIASSGRTLLAIINDLLDYSSLEHSKLSFDLQAMNLQEEISRVVSDMSSLVDEKNNRVEMIFAHDLRGDVICDPLRFKQLIFNLLGNANKFTKGGLIKICVSNPSDGRVKVEVIDDGDGIDSQCLTSLFNAFTKLKTNESGTGLGLVICKSIVEHFDGMIAVESKLGQGANFYFEMSLESVQVKPSKINETISGDEHFIYAVEDRPRMLIAEDNRVNQIVLKKMLKKYHLEADIVADGEDVLKMLSDQKYDLIFMDQNMPVMSGVEATKTLRSRGDESWIVGCSASTMEREKKPV
jgi:signal transduction histidine kinase